MAWTREELDEALRKLDRDIEPMFAGCTDAAQFWSVFQEEARRIEQRAEHHLAYAGAQLNQLLVSHELIPRLRAMRCQAATEGS
jgi:hypothetical protein